LITIKIKVDKASLIGRLELFKVYMKTGLYPAWQRIANVLDGRIKAMVPVRSGNLLSSVKTTAYSMRVSSIANAVDPRSGYIYARINHDGGYASGWAGPHNISGVRYMTIPLHATAGYAVETLSDEIDRIISICGLG
jgi:hypothetical protein